MALQLKPGVTIRGVQPEAVLAMLVVEGVYEHLGLLDTVITSVTDGKHMDNSLHYEGKAFDHRLPSHSGSAPPQDAIAVRLIHERLGPEFNVVLEADHIHTQFNRGVTK